VSGKSRGGVRGAADVKGTSTRRIGIIEGWPFLKSRGSHGSRRGSHGPGPGNEVQESMAWYTAHPGFEKISNAAPARKPLVLNFFVAQRRGSGLVQSGFYEVALTTI